jgi:hypothetical protein
MFYGSPFTVPGHYFSSHSQYSRDYLLVYINTSGEPNTTRSNRLNYNFYVYFAFLDGFFHRFHVELAEPFIIERRFCPYCGLNQEFNLVVTRFANIPMGYMEVIAPGNGIVEDISANIAGKGLHK